MLSDLGRVVGSGVVPRIGCCQETGNSMIGYLNKSYLEGRKNIVKLKL